jgi:hypothetical protein
MIELGIKLKRGAITGDELDEFAKSIGLPPGDLNLPQDRKPFE